MTTATETRTARNNGCFESLIVTDDRCAALTMVRVGCYSVTFGRSDRDAAGRFEFAVRPFDSSKTYKTEAGARRAIGQWFAGR